MLGATSEAALAAAHTAAAALRTGGLRRSIGAPSGPALRTAAAGTAAIVPAAAAAAAERRPGGALAGLADPQRPAAELDAVEFLNRLRHEVGVAELHECETAGPVGGPVHRQDDIDDLADSGERGLQFLPGRLVAQVANEDSGRDGDPPDKVDRVVCARPSGRSALLSARREENRVYRLDRLATCQSRTTHG